MPLSTYSRHADAFLNFFCACRTGLRPRLRYARSHRLCINAAHCPSLTHRLYLNIAPRHHTCHRPQCAVPLSITLRAVHSSHYVPAYSASAGRVQCAVGDTAARQLPSPRTAPCHRVFAAPGFVLPANSSLTPTAFPSRLSRAAGRSPCLQRRLCLAQSQHHKRRLSFTKLTA
ncbi:hypothetical protein B0H13DRAFT_2058407, partial [Mycena leptocephala]